MFTLQNPVSPASWNGIILLTQGFGENRNDFYRQMGMRGHNGLDFSTYHYDKGEAPIYATHDGYVISDKTNQSDTAGRYVKLISDETEIDGRTCKVLTLYFHLKSCRVSVTDDKNNDTLYWKRKGEKYVVAGSVIGLSDNTGRYTTGAHLHFGMYILWKRDNEIYKADNGNGYDGAVDPQVYLKDNNVYQLPWSTFSSKFFHNGKIVSRQEVTTLIPKHLKEQAGEWSINILRFKRWFNSFKQR